MTHDEPNSPVLAERLEEQTAGILIDVVSRLIKCENRRFLPEGNGYLRPLPLAVAQDRPVGEPIRMDSYYTLKRPLR